MLMSAAGVGAVLGAAAVRSTDELQRIGRWDRGDVGDLFGLPDRFLASTNFLVSAALLFVIGFAATSQMAATNTTVQKSRADEFGVA